MKKEVIINDIEICDEELNKEKPDPRFGKHLINAVMKLWHDKLLKQIDEE